MDIAYLKNKSKLLRKRVMHRFKIFLHYHFSRSEKEPIFIIAMRRTGTHLLLSYLNSIPNVFFATEILNRDAFYGLRQRFISKKAALKHILYSIYYCQSRLCGAKLIRIHMENHKLSLTDLIKLFPNAKFIVLYRKIVLEQYLSLKIAENTDTWGLTKDFKLPLSIHIDRNELAAYYASTKKYYEELIKDPCLKGRSILLSYEELANEAQTTFDKRIFPFLGLSSFPVSSQVMKQTTKKPREIVENYEEIKDFDGELINFGNNESKIMSHFQILPSQNGHHPFPLPKSQTAC